MKTAGFNYRQTEKAKNICLCTVWCCETKRQESRRIVVKATSVIRTKVGQKWFHTNRYLPLRIWYSLCAKSFHIFHDSRCWSYKMIQRQYRRKIGFVGQISVCSVANIWYHNSNFMICAHILVPNMVIYGNAFVRCNEEKGNDREVHEWSFRFRYCAHSRIGVIWTNQFSPANPG